jgi:predicted dehydrogenase
VVVIGTGSIGLRHLQVLQGFPNVRPIAIPYRHDRRVELDRLGFLTSMNLGEAVKTWNIEGCIVACDTSRHLADGVEALSHGLHCLVEKPLCRNGSEAKQLHRKALEADRRLYVGCVLRFCESLEQIRAGLDLLGPIHAVRIECQSYLPDWRPDRSYLETYSARENEGGVLRDLVHEVDYAGWLFGWPGSLQARLHNTGTLGIAAEETADLSWETSGGAVITIRLDYLTRPARRRMVVCGRNGTWEWDAIMNRATYQAPGAECEGTTFVQTREAMFADQARAFLAAVDGQVDQRLASGLDGVRAMVVCDAARRASLSRRQEPVEYS